MTVYKLDPRECPGCPDCQGFKARVCAVCGKDGSLAAYDGRGYFHRACFVRARSAGSLPPRVRPMTEGELPPRCNGTGSLVIGGIPPTDPGDHTHQCWDCGAHFECEEPDCDGDPEHRELWACASCPWPDGAPPYDAATATGMYD